MTLFLLVLAGEIIFSLPFHITRFFRPTFLIEFQLSNTQLGDIFAVYGIVAMLSYFPGGIIADRFAPGKLMAFSLFATAAGGLFLLTKPDTTGLAILFGYWGATTILLFWAAMIKGTRLLAGHYRQGKAFGILDGGRGLVASLFASGAVLLFQFNSHQQLSAVVGQTTSTLTLQPVILFYTVTTALTALLIYCFANRFSVERSVQENTEALQNDIFNTLKNQYVWLQGLIVIAAYCGYKSLDNLGLYAVEVLGMSELESAELTSYLSYLRPIAAITVGILADRWSPSRAITVLFALLIISFLILMFIDSSSVFQQLIILNLAITGFAIFALRGVYFTLLEESQLKIQRTGAAVGIISFVGFTPDIFFAPITGRILDANDVTSGFQYYFILMSFISLIGLVAASLFIYYLKRASVKGKIDEQIEHE
ncbi:MFS transporter [Pleionea sediminis]|uniref:MFS transporter n=1 Tax=Pleionea sediminis TaxID=2569479 RepID=UPI00197BD4D9|nr:MFS transporter [Pleionea sediminis]